MIEQKPEKKVVSRTVVIALGIAIVLLVGLVGAIADYSFQISSLNSKLNDLNNIVNFQKTVTWLSNKTITINPNQNFTEGFHAPLSGYVYVVGNVQPPSPNYWINLTYWMIYDYPPKAYTVYPEPFLYNMFPDYFEEGFPVVSFAQALPNPNVGLTIGNGSPDSSMIVNLTVTFTY